MQNLIVQGEKGEGCWEQQANQGEKGLENVSTSHEQQAIQGVKMSAPRTNNRRFKEGKVSKMSVPRMHMHRAGCKRAWLAADLD